MEPERHRDLAIPLVGSLNLPPKVRQTGCFCLFLATSLLCSVLMSPGLYMTFKPENLSCDRYFLLWFQGTTGLNLLTFCILLCQFLLPRDSTDHFWLLSLLPAPLFVLEVVLDLVGAILLSATGCSANCRTTCVAVVVVSLGKQWVHCCYSSTVLSQGCEEYGLRLCFTYFRSNVYASCPVCKEVVTPGQELSPLIHSEGQLLHLKCMQSTENGYIEV